jgi:site-specific DNA-methyltransferase (adenine-specific)
MIEFDTIYNEDCLQGMKRIPDESVDAIICDLPYGTTACAWDSVIPFDKLWEQYRRICKPNAPIVLFGSEPFSTMLRMSNLKEFKYDWIWNKKLAGNGILAKIQPLKIHEIISVFHTNRYYPQKVKGIMRQKMGLKESDITGGDSFAESYVNDEYYPTSIQEFSIAGERSDRLHPTQKPVDLLRYLVLTYTNEGDTVLDNCMGSGTTAIACIKEKRNFVGFELDKEYYNKANKRILAEMAQQTLF